MAILYVGQIERFMLKPLAWSLARETSVGTVCLHRWPSDEMWARARSTLDQRVRLDLVDKVIARHATLRSQASSFGMTEALWRETPAAGRMGELLNRFFADPHGEYALKKSLILDVETRLEVIFAADALAGTRTEPVFLVPTSPLDGTLIDLLSRFDKSSELRVQVWRGQPYWSAFWWRVATSRFRSIVGALRWVVGVPLKRCLLWRGPRQKPYFKVAADNKWAPGSNAVPGRCDDLFLVDGNQIRKEDVLIIFNPRQPGAPLERYQAAGVVAVDPERVNAPIGFWVGSVSPRIGRFLVSALTVGGPIVSVLMNHAVRVVLSAISFELLLQHVRIGVLTSIVEYDASHIVRTLVLNRYGGATVRLPHSQMDYPGAAMAYLHYNVFCSSGEYLPSVWGRSWSPGTRVCAVGLMFGQVGNLSGNAEASEAVEKLVTGFHKRGQRALIVFTSSNSESSPGTNAAAEMDWRILSLVVECCEQLQDVVILIKPKIGHTSFLDQPRFKKLLAPYCATGRVHVLHARFGTECSAAYLLGNSEVCVAYGGSVVIEALQTGIPIFVPLVVPVHITPFVQKFMGTIFFEDPEEFQRVLRATLLGEEWPRPDPSVVREWFDPFCDGHAIDRIRNLVLNLNGQGGGRQHCPRERLEGIGKAGRRS